MSTLSPRYPTQLPSEVEQIVEAPVQILDTLEAADGPVSISIPQQVNDQLDLFISVLEAERVQFTVYAAHKATYSPSLIGAAVGRCGIDVASSKELNNAYAAGFTKDKIIATGPKSSSFLKELATERVVIIVDSVEELMRLIQINVSSAVILLRVSRSVINDPTIVKRSRFGIDAAGMIQARTLLSDNPQIELRGVAFHLDTQSIYEKSIAVQQAAELLQDLQIEFPTATVLDIGGGYGADYGLSYGQAQDFEHHLKHALKTGGDSHTWQQYAYGLRLKDGAIVNELQGVELPTDTSGAERLKAILRSPANGYAALSELLRDNLIELWVEPGSALFYSAGIVAATVIESRQLDGEWIVIVDIHRNQIYFEGNEVLADPLLISRQSPQSNSPVSCFLVGHLCAENDMMSYRKITFDTLPQAGDAIIWTHTGAYRSHFSASAPIGHVPLHTLTYLPNKNSYVLEKDLS